MQNANIADYETFDAYVDSQITDVDLYFLEDVELARQLIALGYHPLSFS